MFWPNPAIIRFSSERVLVLIRSMRLCIDGEISSSVALIKTTDDEISPSLHNRIDLINTDTLSDENLMIAGLGRNM